MSPDIALAFGVLLVALAITSILAALAEGRRPLVGGLLVLGGAASIWLAWQQSGGSLTFEDIPMSFVRLIAEFR
ncbi:hypothetical protein SAMN05421853_10263 [Roseivivax halotolerans]|uniref:Uncharacterized protein n=1 Tax=Roseivivax halotolerans TaxID=93684 RepID=A0A1I5W0T0_9RHOB|nr:hypothetical protein [Roseivivax halotolerans]SFQ13359.1 hypothetical protein SAMN05421853_10263 [Roseivivax halotolerans]